MQIEALEAELAQTKALLVERSTWIANLEAEFKAEKQELKEYYQRSLGELDGNHQEVAAQRMRDEATRTMMQTNILVAAGELHSVKGEFESHRKASVELQASVAESFEALSNQVCDKVYGFSSMIEENMSISQEKLRKEVLERKRLHNVVQELKGNIRVFARSRPLSKVKAPAQRGNSLIGSASLSDGSTLYLSLAAGLRRSCMLACLRVCPRRAQVSIHSACLLFCVDTARNRTWGSQSSKHAQAKASLRLARLRDR